MRKLLTILTMSILLLLVACGGEDADSTKKEPTSESDKDKNETIVFGHAGWTSTEVPTEIAKQILEEVGYDVEITLLDQPLIFEGLINEEIDFFMDAWLPYTEEALWEEYGDDLIKVAESYTDAPLGWVVPSYVEEDTIEEIKQNPEKFDNTIYTIDAGAGIATIAEEVLVEYGLEDDYEISYSSEAAMIGQLDASIAQEEPVIVTGWRPHSIFTQFDLKFLEEPKEIYKYDTIYVISYNDIEEKHPEAFNILSNWSIEIDDLEEMMYEYEMNDIPFEDLAAEWIDENRDKVDEMIGK